MRTKRSVVVAVLGFVLLSLVMVAAFADSYTAYLPFVSRMPTATPMPTPLPTPQAMPQVGTPFAAWGWPGSYQVWVNSLELITVGDCRCYTCPGDDHNHRYTDTWVYIGEGLGTKTFHFPAEFADVVITWGGDTSWAIDAIIGHTVDDLDVGYGYTADGQATASYMDTSAISFATIVYYESLHQPMPEPCGLVGRHPDSSYSVTGVGGGPNQGGVLFRMLRLPWDELWASSDYPDLAIGDFVYTLTSITLHIRSASELGPNDVICP